MQNAKCSSIRAKLTDKTPNIQTMKTRGTNTACQYRVVTYPPSGPAMVLIILYKQICWVIGQLYMYFSKNIRIYPDVVAIEKCIFSTS